MLCPLNPISTRLLYMSEVPIEAPAIPVDSRSGLLWNCCSCHMVVRKGRILSLGLSLFLTALDVSLQSAVNI